MRIGLFRRIVDDIQKYDHYFVQKRDAAGKLGFSPYQKMTSAMRMMAYGCSADSLDEYTQLAESTSLECLKRFCEAIVGIYREEYLRTPNDQDLARLLKVAEKRGFPGMLGSLDCMHWAWKNCPKALHGQYTGKEEEPTIVLEAVASYDLWIWHAFFGLPGVMNDINILDQSPIFQKLQDGICPDIEFKVNGHEYSLGYYLTDGIYPAWATLIQTISAPVGKKNKFLAKRQEACRKDIERTFGVLQARFAIIKNPGRFWSISDLWTIMMAAVLLHNMIIEDERDSDFESNFNYFQSNPPSTDPPPEPSTDFEVYLARFHSIRSRSAHKILKEDLIDHLWNKRGEDAGETSTESEDEDED
ncbi:hypothetical protein MJO29_009813 [Puccinia striiformis f. sp. tritici]|nr:hypothetical protein MJO29_009813 [Puccinia striiformis f. sp. tritici]